MEANDTHTLKPETECTLPASERVEAQSQGEGTAGGVAPSAEDVLAWWRKACLALVGQHKETVGWGFDLAGSCASAEAWMRSVSKLCRDLSAATAEAGTKGARLTLQQQQAVARLLRESQEFFKPSLGPSFPIANANVWPHAAEMARAWSAYVVATQAQTAAAWAEFWKLPAAAE